MDTAEDDIVLDGGGAAAPAETAEGDVDLNVDLSSDEESDEEDDMFAHGTVQFHGYVQTVKANEEPSGKYEPHLEHGAKKKGKSSTTSKKVVTDVPLNQVAYIFDSLTAGKTILKKDKLWISYYCEVAKRQATFECTGVEKFNDELGLKHMPFT